ncbi:MAG: histidine kinase [bacterium]|nr:histidine kinase [bacterium]
MKRFTAQVALLFGLATLLGVFFASRMYVSYAYGGYDASWKTALAYNMPDWYAWALVAPIILWLGRRFPLDGRHWVRRLFIHVPAAVVISLLKIALVYGVTRLFDWLPDRGAGPGTLHSNLITYVIIGAVGQGFSYYQAQRDAQLRTSRLESSLAEARLDSLKLQLQPHFLFNTLHAISSLMHKDVDAADQMIARLSELLRGAIENVGVQEVALKEELEFLNGYLEIERTRFHDRLSIEQDIDPEALDARVPNLMLQPLVENAIRHGIEPKTGPGTIKIRCALHNGALVVNITDDGPGLDGGIREGVGLTNTRSRLEHLYGDAYRLEVVNGVSGGVDLTLEIPYRRHSEDTAT